MYITEPCVAFGLMAKSRKEASREKKIYKINTKYTIYKQTKQRYNNNPTPPSLQKKRKKERKRKERKGKERKGKKKKSFSRNQTQHILFVGKLVTAIPLTDEQPIFVN